MIWTWTFEGSELQKVNGREFRDLVIGGQPLLVQFASPACEPCRALEPTLGRLAAQYQGRLRVVEIDVDEEADLGRRFNVWVLPTLILFQHGQHRRIGARDLSSLDTAMGKLLAEGSTAGPNASFIPPDLSSPADPALLPVTKLHRSLSPFGRDIERIGIPYCLSESGFCLDGLIYRVGAHEAAGIRIGCGQILTNRHVLERLGGARSGPAFVRKQLFTGRPELSGRAAPPALPGGNFVMPWHVGRYGDWALLEETDTSFCGTPRFRSVQSLQVDQTLWLVGGSQGEFDFVTTGRLKYVKGVNGLLSDCDVQPGMSGSAILDASGCVVGIFSTQFGWPGRRAMFVTIDSIHAGIEALRQQDASLPRLRIEAAN